MRIALLSDIHGNSVALDAVLNDIVLQGGVDAYWILGDLVALGPDPIHVLEQLSTLPNAQFIRGNTDRYVAFGDRPGPALQEAIANPGLLPSLVEVANTFAWTQGMITAGGWLNWLRNLPLELNLTLPYGARFLGVHASPGNDDGAGVRPNMRPAELAELFSGCDAALVCIGHTHLPSAQSWNGMHIVNPGAVSLSLTTDKAASYALLEFADGRYTLQHHRVDYDRAAVIDRLNEIGHPGRAYLINHLSDPE
jgi:predicted phosphodiesterase